ncbi:hypothetical protein PF010_g27077 [Phytophthora fragariae]|uniref:Uncharacterized protein n=1 Tax=Phytophthora fragariae TaxID=53985 RepID=A0A6G0JV30_9STRA|nr:hypothetical protein PF010_g27077 [Phytophthora fragariae]
MTCSTVFDSATHFGSILSKKASAGPSNLLFSASILKSSGQSPPLINCAATRRSTNFLPHARKSAPTPA